MVDLAFDQHKVWRQLLEADVFFKDLGGACGASLRNTLGQVANAESKRFASQMKQDTRVPSEFREGM